MDMKHMETVAVDLSKLTSRFHDKTLGEMAEVAAQVEAKAYAGGWVQMANWGTTNYVPAVSASLTTASPGTILLPAANPPDAFLPANSLHLHTQLRMRVWGSITNSGAFTFALAGCIGVVGTTTAIIASATGTPATGPLPFWFESEYTVLQIGAAATSSIIGQGLAWGITATPATTVLVPATAPTALAATWSTQNANALVPTGWWGTAQAGITVYGYSVEQLN
jgi:hypothetical protein